LKIIVYMNIKLLKSLLKELTRYSIRVNSEQTLHWSDQILHLMKNMCPLGNRKSKKENKLVLIKLSWVETKLTVTFIFIVRIDELICGFEW